MTRAPGFVVSRGGEDVGQALGQDDPAPRTLVDPSSVELGHRVTRPRGRSEAGLSSRATIRDRAQLSTDTSLRINKRDLIGIGTVIFQIAPPRSLGTEQ